MKKLFIALLLSLSAFSTIQAQVVVTEISWQVYTQQYVGLLVIYPGDSGIFVVKFFSPQLGWVWVQQDAYLTFQQDVYGNLTSYINCHRPRTTPFVPYAADNFVIFPNGQMFTKDASGTWSKLVVQQVIPEAYWETKFAEYGIE